VKPKSRIAMPNGGSKAVAPKSYDVDRSVQLWV
jgi:hypothetical protein